ncbi:hypothetical protein [Paracoccus aminophilus]|uniref:Uncharacterized protein n=1 Tax=Paracoccus aminophilus JCM 7686 TaxID=1367847 RepID=S5XJK1_PARAH|nr:hypothetical protein [Paracoccus aminophilus]AGT07364.1 hypothetical protein JCM7686_0253 [Paracoccus aminophilus JCM 7686]
MNDFRDSFRRFAHQQSKDGLTVLGAVATVVWLVLILLFWLFGTPADETVGGGVAGLLRWVGLVTPIALIWMAVWQGRAIAALRLEAIQLRTTLDILRKGGQAVPADEIPAAPSVARTIPTPPASSGAAAARRNEPDDQGQASLGLETPPPLELDEYELIAALNFPDGPDDVEAVAALRKALADRELARLIRAAQDVVTLLAKRGIFMDDLYAGDAQPGLWRQFADGLRGAALTSLALDVDEPVLEATAKLLRSDEVFRDTAQHFLRHFDKLVSRAAPELDDRLLLALTYTRSGRAFTLLAQVAGMIGSYVPQESPDA